MFLDRRKELYSIFQKHDILIIEDDPYCIPPFQRDKSDLDFLQMEEYPVGGDESMKSTFMTGRELLKSLIPSFLSLDTDGRVVRLDSLSKVLAPGIRLGLFPPQLRLPTPIISLFPSTPCHPAASKAPTHFPLSPS
jgi:aromatic amino acid aminotransferase I / 2-aminoadipate transaminase